MAITQTQRNEIEIAMKDAARAVAVKHGLAVDFNFDVGTYAMNMKAGITFAEMDKMGIPMSHERRMFEHLASRYGLQPSDFGKTFFMKGTQYRITGINPNAPRFAVNVERVHDSKGFRIPPRDVINSLGHVANAA